MVRSPNGKVLLAFSSPYHDTHKAMNHDLSLHGDGVKDVAFLVEDCIAMYEKAISRGAVSVSGPKELKDENGLVIMATIQTVIFSLYCVFFNYLVLFSMETLGIHLYKEWISKGYFYQDMWLIL